ncbi:hypothetical protein [Polyangium sp. 15x6]|nr:hypothetical protein [Polyangium sp. 15x6]MDI3284124.1 hypothetical protein [Polyangium sp. 15x6]
MRAWISSWILLAASRGGGGESAMGMGDLAATDYILDFLEVHPMP